jgi:hypothetical protein
MLREAIMVRQRTFKGDFRPVPERWQQIARAKKTIQTWPEWSAPPQPPAKRTSRDDLNTAAAEPIELTVPLADEHGVGLEGVRLVIIAWPYRKLEDITAVLQVTGGRSFTVVARLDAWAPDPHLNVRARNYPGLGHLPPEVGQHHVHRFKDNAKLGLDAFGAENLPLAAQVTDRLESYRDFLRVVGAEFNIEGLDQLEPPDWSGLI